MVVNQSAGTVVNSPDTDFSNMLESIFNTFNFMNIKSYYKLINNISDLTNKIKVEIGWTNKYGPLEQEGFNIKTSIENNLEPVKSNARIFINQCDKIRTQFQIIQEIFKDSNGNELTEKQKQSFDNAFNFIWSMIQTIEEIHEKMGKDLELKEKILELEKQITWEKSKLNELGKTKVKNHLMENKLLYTAGGGFLGALLSSFGGLAAIVTESVTFGKAGVCCIASCTIHPVGVIGASFILGGLLVSALTIGTIYAIKCYVEKSVEPDKQKLESIEKHAKELKNCIDEIEKLSRKFFEFKTATKSDLEQFKMAFFDEYQRKMIAKPERVSKTIEYFDILIPSLKEITNLKVPEYEPNE